MQLNTIAFELQLQSRKKMTVELHHRIRSDQTIFVEYFYLENEIAFFEEWLCGKNMINFFDISSYKTERSK